MNYHLASQLAPMPLTRRGYKSVLSVSPDGENLLYSHGRSVIIRNLNNPSKFLEVVKNQCEVTATKYSPSGNYIASGDARGTVLVWAVDNEEHTVKHEFQPLSGRVNGIAWDSTSSRLAIVGEGREKYGSVVLLGTQSSIGTISSHSMPINAVSYSHGKAKLIVTASDDCTVGLYVGIPFKTEKIITDHKRFVHCVEFSPDSKYFASCGADGIVNIYTAEVAPSRISSLQTPSKGSFPGSLYSLSWSKDGSKIAGSSATNCTYLWDVETGDVIRTLKGPETYYAKDQHSACLYLDDRIVTLSLSQEINYFDPDAEESVLTIKGHKGPINSILVNPNSEIYTSGAHGVVCSWNPSADNFQVKCPAKPASSTTILDSVSAENGLFISSSNDSVSYLDYESGEFKYTILTPGCPTKLAYDQQSKKCLVVVNGNILCFLNNESVLKTVKLPYEITALALSPDQSLLAVGSSSDNNVKIYEYCGENTELCQPGMLCLTRNLSTISSIEFSHDSKWVAVGDISGKLFVYDCATGEVVIKDWVSHSSKINCIKWSPDSMHAASASLDTSIEVWSVQKPRSHITIRPAHTGSTTGLVWISDDRIASIGQDGLVKEWVIDL